MSIAAPEQTPPSPPSAAPQRKAPTITPVVIWTVIFGLLGIVSAALRADKARKAGLPERGYWIAWAVTCFVNLTVWALLGALLALAGQSVATDTAAGDDSASHVSYSEESSTSTESGSTGNDDSGTSVASDVRSAITAVEKFYTNNGYYPDDQISDDYTGISFTRVDATSTRTSVSEGNVLLFDAHEANYTICAQDTDTGIIYFYDSATSKSVARSASADIYNCGSNGY